MKSIVGERGQIVIPKQIRERLGLEKGMVLEVETTKNDDAIMLKPTRKKRRDWTDWIGAFQEEGLVEEYLKDKKSDKKKERKWIK